MFDAGRLGRLGIDPALSRSVDVTVTGGGTVRAHALDAAPRAGVEPPLTVVCVHGNPTWSFMWRSFHRRLADRYRVIAIDQISMGLSERTGQRQFARRVDDLGRILDAFGVEGPVVLAAHDWGGPIALAWALEQPERVRGILLCNTGVALPAAGVPLPIRLAGSRVLRDVVCRRTTLFLRATLATARGRIDRRARNGYEAPYRTGEDRRAISDFVADIPTGPDHPSYAALAEVAARLPGLDMPVLLAWGERDPVFHLGFAADLRRRLPQAELHRFPLAGHLVVEEEDVAALTDAWIGSLLHPNEPAAESSAGADPAEPEAPWAALVARENDDTNAVWVGGGESLSFAALAQRVADLAVWLRTAGVAPGDRVALLAPAPSDFLAAAYACWVIGAVTVVVDRGLGLKGLGRALRSAEPRWLLGTAKTLGAARALRWAPTAGRLDLSALRPQGGLLSATVADRESLLDATAAVVFTSGATGPAKGVLYTQRQMAAQFAAVRACYSIGPADRLVAAFAPFALYGPALGIPVAVPDCDITRPASLRADSLADACAAVGATIVFAAPAALGGVLASRKRLSAGHREALGALRLVLSAGAPVSQRILRDVADLTPRAELHTPYGMTEVLSVADIDLSTLEEIGPGRGVCVGRPLAGVGLRIEPLPDGDGETGEIVVSAPWLSAGYDGLWATTDHARTVDTLGVEWHRTGDVGHLGPGGELWVEGRMAHVVDTADGPVTPVPIESALEWATGWRSAVTGVGPPGCRQIVVVVERDGKAGLAAPAVDRAVRRALAPQAIAAVLTVPELPVDRRHNSKIDRTRLGRWAELLLAGGSPATRRRRSRAQERLLMRVLVTGGSSLLGQTTIAALEAGGHEVVALQRHPSAKLDCEQVLADICDARRVAGAAAGCDAVVHSAARVGVLGSREEFRRVNVGGTDAVVAACLGSGVPRLVFVSSPSVGYESVPTVGAGAGAPITSRHDRSWYSESKARAETLALSANSPALAVTAIRPHAIWGPGDTQLVGRIVERARAGRLFVVGGGTALIDTTYVDNAADALVIAVEQLATGSPLAGHSFVVSNGEPLPVRVLLEWICAAARVPAPRRDVPLPVARRLAAVAERMWAHGRPDAEPPATRFLVDQLGLAHWFDPRPFREATGWRPAVSVEEGMRRLAASYRN